jgi:hypothetical protein
MRTVLDRPSYRDRSAEIAHRIGTEDGPGAVLSLITQLEMDQEASARRGRNGRDR